MDDMNSSIQQASRQPSAFTGGQKAGWFLVGMFGGVMGILIASLCNVNHPDRYTATKMAAIGMAVDIALFFLLFAVSCSVLSAAVYNSVTSSYYGY